MATFVLIHGAWHGGWVWQPVSTQLQQYGHKVFCPSMLGCGERAYLIGQMPTIDDIVEDLVSHIRQFLVRQRNLQEAQQLVLVGHSFGGAVMSAVAEQLAEYVGALIYLDAAVLQGGESMFSCMSETLAAERKQLALETSDGLSLPVPTGEQLGVLDGNVWQWLRTKLTVQSVSSYDSKLTLQSNPGSGFPCAYVVCKKPLFEPLEWARQRVAHSYWSESWHIVPIATGHDAMVTAPDTLTAIILELAQRLLQRKG